jgi:hypothetical protein
MLSKSILPALLLLTAGIAPGCGSESDNPTMDTNIGVEGYDKSCATDTDCVSVFVGNVCGCGCDEEVIRASELDRFNQEVQSRRAQCGQVLTCAPCPDSPPPICKAGQCSF